MATRTIYQCPECGRQDCRGLIGLGVHRRLAHGVTSPFKNGKPIAEKPANAVTPNVGELPLAVSDPPKRRPRGPYRPRRPKRQTSRATIAAAPSNGTSPPRLPSKAPVVNFCPGCGQDLRPVSLAMHLRATLGARQGG